MAVTVAFRQRLRPDDVGNVVAAVRTGFAGGRDARLGRRRARLFERLGDPLDLLSIEEWEGPEAVEAYVESSRYAELAAACEAPPLVRYYVPVRSFELVLQPVAIAAGAIIAAPPAARAAVEAYLRGAAWDVIVGTPGIRYCQVNRDVASPGVFLLLHGWAALEDLERFRRDVAPALGPSLKRFGAAVHRFTGLVVADTDRDS